MTELPDPVFPSELISIIVNPLDTARACHSVLAPATHHTRDKREHRGGSSSSEGPCSYTRTCVNALQSLAFSCLLGLPCVMEAICETEQKRNKHRHKHTTKEMEDTQRKKGSKHEQRGAEYPSPPAQGTCRGSNSEISQILMRVRITEASSESKERASLVEQSPASNTPATPAFPCFVAYEEARSLTAH